MKTGKTGGSDSLRRTSILVGVLLLATGVWARRADGIEATVYAHAGLDHFYNLEYKKAAENFKQAIKADPDNLIFYNFLTTNYLFEELYDLGQLQGNLYASSNQFLEEEKPDPNPERMKRIRARIEEVTRRCDERLEKNSRDTRALYAKGLARAIEANIAFTIEKKYLDALRAGSEANDLHRKVLKINPNFHDAKVVRGVYEYVVGSIPWSVKWLAFLAGYRGSKEKGIELLKEAMLHARWVSSDAAVLLAVVYTREEMHAYSRRLFRHLTEYYPRNPLYFLEIGRSYQREGKLDKALEIYHEAAERLEAGQPGYANHIPRERLYYEIGTLHEQKGETDKALRAYGQITQQGEGDSRLRAHAALRRGDLFRRKKQPEEARQEYKIAASLPHEEIQQQARKRLQTLGR